MDTYPSESRPLLRINLAAVSFFFFPKNHRQTVSDLSLRLLVE